MTLNLISDQIIVGSHRLGFDAHTLDFTNESEQEAGIIEYQKGGWTIVKAGLETKRNQYFFQAIKPKVSE